MQINYETNYSFGESPQKIRRKKKKKKKKNSSPSLPFLPGRASLHYFASSSLTFQTFWISGFFPLGK